MPETKVWNGDNWQVLCTIRLAYWPGSSLRNHATYIQLLNAEIFYLYLFWKSERGSLFRRVCVTEHEIILFLLVVELLGKTSFAPSSLFILTRFLFLFLFIFFFASLSFWYSSRCFITLEWISFLKILIIFFLSHK